MTLMNDRPGRGFMASLLGLLLMQSAPVPAGAEPDSARAWIDKMVQTLPRLNYDGTFIYQHGEQLEAVRIIHQSGPQGERERLVSLTGAAREIIQDGEQVTCYLPDQKSVMVGRNHPRKPYPPNLPHDLDRLARHYEFNLLGTERMAGYETRVIAIKPRDAYRYGYRLWLEQGTGMPLKSDLLDEQGTAVEQVMFTNLQFLTEVPAASLQPTLDSAGFAWHRDGGGDQETSVDQTGWQVTGLPDGFMLTHHSRHPMPDSPVPAEHLVFSDGLASFSVYIEAADDDRKMLNGFSRMGAVNAYGAVVAAHHITVVGEIPRATVRQVGESVQRHD